MHPSIGTDLHQVRRRDEGPALAAGSAVVLPKVKQVPYEGHVAARGYPPHGNLCQGRAACLGAPASQSLTCTVHAKECLLLCTLHVTGICKGARICSGSTGLQAGFGGVCI